MTPYGIDYKLSVFGNDDSSTRIRYLWDQTLRSSDTRLPPTGFALGVEFVSAQIDRALAINDPISQYELLLAADTSGHGTAVAGIVAGASDFYLGVAPSADLLIVKLGLPNASSFPYATEIMRGVAYAVNKAIDWQTWKDPGMRYLKNNIKSLKRQAGQQRVLMQRFPN